MTACIHACMRETISLTCMHIFFPAAICVYIYTLQIACMQSDMQVNFKMYIHFADFFFFLYTVKSEI